MAIGTVTTKSSDHRTRDERVTVTDVVLPASYTTDGDALTADQLSLAKVNHAIAVVKVAGTGSVTAAHYDIANSKLIAYAAGAQIGSGVNCSAVTVQITAFGV